MHNLPTAVKTCKINKGTRMTSYTTPKLHGACECGICAFELSVTPTTRFICHCTICQAFTDKPYADMTIVRAKHLRLINVDKISFEKYRPPPNINRGLCLNCKKPVVEFGGLGPLKWVFIPASNFESQALLSAPQTYLFYNRHVTEALDNLPKHSGYFRSQIAIGKMLIKSF